MVYITPSYNSIVEIVRPDYTTRNKVIFYNRDSITIEDFWRSDAAVYPREDYDATLTRIN